MAAQATVSLEKAKRLEPDKASIRRRSGSPTSASTAGRRRRHEFRSCSSCRPPTTTPTTRSAAASRSWAGAGRRTATTSSRARSARQRAVRVARARPRQRAARAVAAVRAVVQRVSRRASSWPATPSARSGPDSASCSGSLETTAMRPPLASPARSRGSGSSRTRTVGSRAACSTSAAPPSSSASSRCSPIANARREPGRTSRRRRRPNRRSRSTSGSAKSSETRRAGRNRRVRRPHVRRARQRRAGHDHPRDLADARSPKAVVPRRQPSAATATSRAEVPSTGGRVRAQGNQRSAELTGHRRQRTRTIAPHLMGPEPDRGVRGAQLPLLGNDERCAKRHASWKWIDLLTARPREFHASPGHQADGPRRQVGIIMITPIWKALQVLQSAGCHA